jgi:2-polyprenyl-3-methyl-5-hydroxy-6-metoxy-1,4-benzoquinol methylase
VKNEPGSTNITIPDLESIKARMKSTWMAGDFGRIAKLNEAAAAADEFIARRDLKPGLRVLDVACGTGNLAIPAARTGAVVRGVDIAANLLEQTSERAKREAVEVTFDEGGSRISRSRSDQEMRN